MEINKITNDDFVIDSNHKRHYIKPDIIKNMENNKKMTQEQKAKAYDEVRKKIALRFGSNVVEEIFSEFEMSEDERTRKRLIHLVNKSHEQGGYALHKDEAEEMLAWLEKQAQSMTITIPKDLKGTDTDGGVVGEKGEQGEQPPEEEMVGMGGLGKVWSEQAIISKLDKIIELLQSAILPISRSPYVTPIIYKNPLDPDPNELGGWKITANTFGSDYDIDTDKIKQDETNKPES